MIRYGSGEVQQPKTIKKIDLHWCPICEKPYVYYPDLRDHVKNAHGREMVGGSY